jgi:hypothetical protein
MRGLIVWCSFAEGWSMAGKVLLAVGLGLAKGLILGLIAGLLLVVLLDVLGRWGLR